MTGRNMWLEQVPPIFPTPYTMVVGETKQEIKQVITSPSYYISIFGGAFIAALLAKGLMLKKKINYKQLIILALIFGATISVAGIISMYAAYYIKPQ